VRFFPALAYAVQIFLTGLIARELGGKRFAIGLACSSVLVAPVILGNATRLSMNPFEPLFWMGCVYCLLLASRRHQPKWLLGCGVLLGLGLLNKPSALFFILALMAGLLATTQRKLLTNRWFWMGAAIAFLLCVPTALWQMQHHFPMLQDLHNVKVTHKNIELPPLSFLRQQILILNPLSALVWVAGLAYLLLHREGKRHRWLGITYLVFLAIMMGLKGKDYYLAPIYPMLFAAGGVFWDKFANSRPYWRWCKVALPVLVLAMGLILLPLTLPLLPVERVAPYMESLGIRASRTETRQRGVLPQYFGDQFGWPEMVAAVAGVYNAMPAEQREKTAILAGNYGEAGAIDFFGKPYGLPKSISAHQNYYYWGYRQYTGESLILLGWDLERARQWCREVIEGPTLDPYYGMSEEHFTILTCHGLKEPLSTAWPKFKVWN
jgi:hypothetical protein